MLVVSRLSAGRAAPQMEDLERPLAAQAHALFWGAVAELDVLPITKITLIEAAQALKRLSLPDHGGRRIIKRKADLAELGLEKVREAPVLDVERAMRVRWFFAIHQKMDVRANQILAVRYFFERLVKACVQLDIVA